MLSFLSAQMCLLSSVEFLCLAWRNDAMWFPCRVLRSVSVSPMYVSGSCAHNLTDLQGNFSSPNYPSSYPHNMNCIWSITLTPGSYIYLQFSKFSLEYGYDQKHCPFDYVEVSDKNYPSSFIQIKRCGDQSRWCVWSKSNLLHVRFVTDSSVSASGFMAHYATYGNPAKPKVIIPLQEVRTVSVHYDWYLSEVTPPISISMMNSSSTLASGTKKTVWSKINQDGNYSCIATNEVGTESKTFSVSLIDFRICLNLCHCHGAFFFAFPQVANIFNCTGKHSAHILTNIPTTTTELYLTENEITQFSENVFSGLTQLSELYLDQNKITQLPENVFSGLTHLSELYLTENEITQFPENVFSGLTQLSELLFK
ncbi:uncharacterized protein [Montipora capricornis]|uniref:uncharacterized protein isoform X2 n=1 Tax=Montipora capricornis TaxID=246305 RepID=UPI0035F1A5DE